ncbi:MAG: thioredoxin domain-containing protein [Vampirovibrionales bacterium]|nr:thioredoxin domain-containing protein [Vampirovibrionales bacterium]
MFKNNFGSALSMSLMVIALVFGVSFATQWTLSGKLPSAYDPGVSLEEAVKTSDKPLLIEFYSDTCATCQAVTPIVHRTIEQHFKNAVTVVMVDTEDPKAAQTVEMFGVTAIPALFVLDARTVKKTALPFDSYGNPPALKTEITKALAT